MNGWLVNGLLMIDWLTGPLVLHVGPITDDFVSQPVSFGALQRLEVGFVDFGQNLRGLNKGAMREMSARDNRLTKYAS